MKVHNVKAKVVDVNGLYIIYEVDGEQYIDCLLYTSPSPRDS